MGRRDRDRSAVLGGAPRGSPAAARGGARERNREHERYEATFPCWHHCLSSPPELHDLLTHTHFQPKSPATTRERVRRLHGLVLHPRRAREWAGRRVAEAETGQPIE